MLGTLITQNASEQHVHESTSTLIKCLANYAIRPIYVLGSTLWDLRLGVYALKRTLWDLRFGSYVFLRNTIHTPIAIWDLRFGVYSRDTTRSPWAPQNHDFSVHHHPTEWD